ncbi:MAG: GMC oxidoreductase [Phycisphaerae bacterium]
MTTEAWDLLVIGSGFGGCIAARRGAAAGLRTVVLERGPRLDGHAFAALADGRGPLVERRGNGGLVHATVARRLLALSGSAVGGTSHLYTAVSVPPPDELFAGGWPSGWSAASLAPFVRRVLDRIDPSACPRELPRFARLALAARDLGGVATRLPLAMTWRGSAEPPATGVRASLVQWLRGGLRQAKRTCDERDLRPAERDGAVVCPRHAVELIAPDARGYRVRAVRTDRGETVEFVARRVVLAAGTLGTVQLLLHCRDRARTLPRLSPRLGERFFTNGDYGALLVSRRPLIESDDGPPVSGWIDLWRQERLYLMETGPLPLPGLGRLSGFARGQRPARHRLWSFAVMGQDPTPGTLRLSRRGGLRYDAAPSAAGQQFARARHARLRELAAALSARLLAPPPLLAERWPVTVHPLGGAALADTPDGGATDATGELFGCPGLYVADGSLLPAPIGRPPSVTIAALAERVMEHLLERARA